MGVSLIGSYRVGEMIDKKYQVLFQEVPLCCILCDIAAILAILLRVRTELSGVSAGGIFAVGSGSVRL